MRPMKPSAVLLGLALAASQVSAAPAAEYVEEIYIPPNAARSLAPEPEGNPLSENLLMTGAALLVASAVLSKQARDITRKERDGVHIHARKQSHRKLYAGLGAASMMAGALALTIGVTIRF